MIENSIRSLTDHTFSKARSDLKVLGSGVRVRGSEVNNTSIRIRTSRRIRIRIIKKIVVEVVVRNGFSQFVLFVCVVVTLVCRTFLDGLRCNRLGDPDQDFDFRNTSSHLVPLPDMGVGQQLLPCFLN